MVREPECVELRAPAPGPNHPSIKEQQTSNMRVKSWWRIFGGTILALLVLISGLLPWWTCQVHIPDMESGAESIVNIRIFSWGLRHDFVQLRNYIEADETPLIQSVLSWAFITLVIMFTMLGIVLNNKKAKFMILGAGLTYLIYGAVAMQFVIGNRTKELGIKLIGWSNVTYQGTVDIVVSFYSSIQPAYYFAIVTGAVLVIVSLLLRFVFKGFYIWRGKL